MFCVPPSAPFLPRRHALYVAHSFFLLFFFFCTRRTRPQPPPTLLRFKRVFKTVVERDASTADDDTARFYARDGRPAGLPRRRHGVCVSLSNFFFLNSNRKIDFRIILFFRIRLRRKILRAVLAPLLVLVTAKVVRHSGRNGIATGRGCCVFLESGEFFSIFSKALAE